MNPSSSFKQRLAQDRAVLAPGVYDALSALAAEQAGFEALYLSGASIAYTRLGRSDVGLTTYTEVADTLARITERVSLPVIVDADTGFGNALNVMRTIKGFERAGAAMIQLEDQTFPKRCGHLGECRQAHVGASQACVGNRRARQVERLEAGLLGHQRAQRVVDTGGQHSLGLRQALLQRKLGVHGLVSSSVAALRAAM